MKQRFYLLSNAFAITVRFGFIPLCYTSLLLLPVALLRAQKAPRLALSNFTKTSTLILKVLLIFSLINILPMAVNAQKQPILQNLLKTHQVHLWKAERLSQLLLQQGATSVDWQVEVWELGYEVELKVNTPGQEPMEVYLESYLPGKSTKVYVNPQTKQTTVTQLYEGITEEQNQKVNPWLRYFDGSASLLAIANQILSQCDYRQTIKMSLQPQKIQINYTNWRNARSIKHKKNYHMLKLEIAIAQDFPKSWSKTFQFGEHMQVVFSDTSSEQNRREGERILDKIKALHQTFEKD